MRRAHYLAALPILMLFGSHARADEHLNFEAYANATAAIGIAPGKPVSMNGTVTSTDELRGTPTFYWAQLGVSLPASLATQSPEVIARHHITTHASLYNLTQAAIDTGRVVLTHDTGRGGIIVVFRQSINGVELQRSDMKVLMDRQGRLVAISGSLDPLATTGAEKKLPKTKVNPTEAIARGLQDLYGTAPNTQALSDLKTPKGGYSYFGLDIPLKAGAKTISFTEPARIKKVIYPMPDKLVPAYYLEIQASEASQTTSDVFAYIIASDDGRLLSRRNLTEDATATYRVWADPNGEKIPNDGPFADFTPHPTGLPDFSAPGPTAPVLVSVDGLNTNPGGTTDPWLAAGATETNGNNVDAYTDSLPPDGFTAGTDIRADVTAPATFDYTYDLAIGPLVNVTQSKAAITQLFYTNNWLHDWWYGSGFHESAGNGQADNFGRGGIGDDAIHAEAQDGAITPASRNNANMSTPADGASPRMQMFLWSGQNDLNLNIGAPINASYATNSASFGAQNFDITAELVLADDGVAVNTNACEPIVNNIAGKIALVDRGVCAFTIKAKNVQNAGAIGMLVANNAPNAAPPGLGGADPTVTIGTLSTTLENGNLLKAQLLNGPLTIQMKRLSGVEVDGTIDNSIIAHEFGHYLHNRLVSHGTTQSRGMGEGWGDFNALLMSMKEGDNFATGTYGLTTYAGISFANEGYYGIRRLPYTRDLTKNPFTFQHIADAATLPNIPKGSGGSTNSEVHNSGEIWAQMLFDGYTDLIMSGGHTFAESKRRMADYIVQGMIMAPVDTNWGEQRDAILAASYAADPADMLILATQFARRGLGSCAVSPPRYSTNNNGVVESYELKARQVVLSAKLDDSVKSCDNDGILDGDEIGLVTIEIKNNGPITMPETTAKVLAGDPGVVLPDGDTILFPPLAPFTKATQTVKIALDNSFTNIEYLNLDVVAMNSGTCVASTSLSVDPRVNMDNVLATSKTDSMDSDKSAWTPKGTRADKIWSITRDASNNYQWVGVGFGTQTDTALETPDLQVSAAESFVFSFQHAFEFEASGTPVINYDGAVIEYSADGGTTWNDINAIVSAGYNGTITTTSNNTMGGRQGFVGKNAGHPAKSVVSYDFGTAFAGQTVRLRFRIATDSGTGTPGWQIDNIAVSGIDNTPFSTAIADAAVCNGVPVADAGPDQTVMGTDMVALDASGSSDPDNDPLTFAWTQISGTPASLVAGNTAMPTFVAPDVAASEVLSFQVSVSDGKGSAGDIVDIVVNAKPQSGTGGAGGTGVGGSGGAGGSGAAGGSGGAGGTGAAGGSGGAGGTGAAGGSGGAGGTGAAGGSGGAGGDTTSSSSSSGESTAASSGSGGSGGGLDTDTGCGCTVAGEEKTPIGASALSALGAMLAFAFRRGRRSGKREN